MATAFGSTPATEHGTELTALLAANQPPLPGIPPPGLLAKAPSVAEAMDAILASAAQLLHKGDFAAARDQYNQALLANLGAQRAHAGLYYACAGLGDDHTAAMHLSKALQLQSIVALPWRGPNLDLGAPVSVLLLQSIHAGNVLVQRLLDDRIFRTHVLVVEFYEPRMPLPPHQVVFNAIGDADIRAEALNAANAVFAHTQAPVINPPAAVLATGRVQNAQRLAAIPGVRSPITVSLTRALLESPDAPAILASHGLEFPLLLRAPGFHMGQHFVGVEEASDLAAALDELPGDDLIAIQFLNGRAADELVRKYRVLIVGGEVYPVHLAVSNHWKVHFFSAEMAEHPERRAEDERFLNDMPGFLGPAVMAALEQIRDTLCLDYGGVDFGIDQQGQLLLYEANANMAIIRPDANSLWDYRRPAIERIHAAVHAMLRAKAFAA